MKVTHLRNAIHNLSSQPVVQSRANAEQGAGVLHALVFNDVIKNDEALRHAPVYALNDFPHLFNMASSVSTQCPRYAIPWRANEMPPRRITAITQQERAGSTCTHNLSGDLQQHQALDWLAM